MDDELISQALCLRMVDLSNRDSVDILANAYKQVFHQDICLTCGGDIRNAYYKLNAYFKNPNVMKTKGVTAKLYKLKQGTIVIHPVTGELYSNMNLTDDVAAEILRIAPTYEKRFETIAHAHIEAEQIPVVDKKAAIENYMEGMKLSELKGLAKDKKLPKKEWVSLSKDKLIKYLTGK